jgi:hypothetical protein
MPIDRLEQVEAHSSSLLVGQKFREFCMTCRMKVSTILSGSAGFAICTQYDGKSKCSACTYNEDHLECYRQHTAWKATTASWKLQVCP